MIKLDLKQNKLVLFHLLGRVKVFNNGANQGVCIFMDPIRDGEKIFISINFVIICFVTSWKAILSDTLVATERQY